MSGFRQRQPRYEDVDHIADVDGVVAVITRSTTNGRLSVGFFKEFLVDEEDPDGPKERTAFVREKQLDAIERLIPQIRKRLQDLARSTPPVVRAR